MSSQMRAVLLVARLLLAAVFLTHGLGKIGGYAAFADKFNLPPSLIVLLIIAELAGTAAVLLGAAPVEPWARWATWAGAAVLAITQVAAIVVVHAPRWFVFSNGMEFNVCLIGLCLILILGHQRRQPALARA